HVEEKILASLHVHGDALGKFDLAGVESGGVYEVDAQISSITVEVPERRAGTVHDREQDPVAAANARLGGLGAEPRDVYVRGDLELGALEEVRHGSGCGPRATDQVAPRIVVAAASGPAGSEQERQREKESRALHGGPSCSADSKPRRPIELLYAGQPPDAP